MVSRPEVVVIPTPGLGNSSYLVGAGEQAVAIDVRRDAWRVRDAAEERGWRITYVLETHVHNDYLSGALELAAHGGTTVVAPADGGYAFAHHPAGEGFELDLGDDRPPRHPLFVAHLDDRVRPVLHRGDIAQIRALHREAGILRHRHPLANKRPRQLWIVLE